MQAEVGDLVLWTANNRGVHLGSVYGFDINDNPLIEIAESGKKQMITKGSYLVLYRYLGGRIADQRIRDAVAWWENR